MRAVLLAAGFATRLFSVAMSNFTVAIGSLTKSLPLPVGGIRLMISASRAAMRNKPVPDPPSMIGVVSPIRRLNSRAMRPGSVAPRRTAESAVRIVPSSRMKTTDGIVADRLPSSAIWSRSPRDLVWE